MVEFLVNHPGVGCFLHGGRGSGGKGVYQDHAGSYPYEDVDEGQERDDPDDREGNIVKPRDSSMIILQTFLHLRGES